MKSINTINKQINKIFARLSHFTIIKAENIFHSRLQSQQTFFLIHFVNFSKGPLRRENVSYMFLQCTVGLLTFSVAKVSFSGSFSAF